MGQYFMDPNVDLNRGLSGVWHKEANTFLRTTKNIDTYALMKPRITKKDWALAPTGRSHGPVPQAHGPGPRGPCGAHKSQTLKGGPSLAHMGAL